LGDKMLSPERSGFPVIRKRWEELFFEDEDSLPDVAIGVLGDSPCY
jgi:hypothetical protein